MVLIMENLTYTVTIELNSSKKQIEPRDPVLWCVANFEAVGPRWDWKYISDYKNGDKIAFYFRDDADFTHFSLAWR